MNDNKIYASRMKLPRREHRNTEDFPAAGEPDPVNLIGTGIHLFSTREKGGVFFPPPALT